MYANADSPDHEPIALILTKNDIRVQQLAADYLLKELDSIIGDAIRSFQQDQVELVRSGTNNRVTLGGLIAFYRDALTNHESPYKAMRIPLARALYHVLIAPIEQDLQSVQKIMIIPNGMLNYLPFDTLENNQQQPLVMRWEISLGHGLQISHRLAQRAPGNWTTPLLALGGAIYNPQTYQGDMQESLAEQGRDAYLHQLHQTMVDRKATTPYAAHAGRVSTNLPGTLSEVKQLADRLPGTLLLTGKKASEPIIHQLSAQRKLTPFRSLHHAVHGTHNPYSPELSALLLSRHLPIRKDSPANNDTFLSLIDIGQLNLRSDIVVLSACETGQGAIFAGQGVVGLTQGFLSAGSDHVLASLWPVSDVATAKFMVQVYDLVYDKGLHWAAAIQQTKRIFLTDAQLQEYRHPYFWAPFNVYGAPHIFSTNK